MFAKRIILAQEPFMETKLYVNNFRIIIRYKITFLETNLKKRWCKENYANKTKSQNVGIVSSKWIKTPLKALHLISLVSEQ